MLHVAHLDELPVARFTYGHIDATWTYVATAEQGGLMARRAGCRRAVVAPGASAVPVHQHLGAEEVFVILAGDGLAYELDGDGERTFRVRAGDLVVRRANREAHALVAGSQGLELLAYGPSAAPRAEVFPRAGVLRLRQRWLEMDGGVHPWEREAALGPPALPEPAAERPARYVHVDDVPAAVGMHGVEVRRLGEAGGAEQVGVRRIAIAPGHADGPRRVHSAVERLVLVVAGEGQAQCGERAWPLAVGSVVSAQPGAGRPWRLVAGDAGLDLLDLSVLDPGDAIHLPDTAEVLLPALGVALPARPVDA